MPRYDYRCVECGVVIIDVFHSMHSTAPVPCLVCNRPMAKVPSLPHTDIKEFHKPIEMYSVAMDDDEAIRDFKVKCPDVDVSMDPRDEMYGIPIARNRKQKLQALKAAEFQEAK